MNQKYKQLKLKLKYPKYRIIKIWSKELNVPYRTAFKYFKYHVNFKPVSDTDVPRIRLKNATKTGDILVTKKNQKYYLIKFKSLMKPISKYTNLPLFKSIKELKNESEHELTKQLIMPNISYTEGDTELHQKSSIAIPTKTSYQLTRASDMYDKFTTLTNQSCYYLTTSSDNRHLQLSVNLNAIKSKHNWKELKYRKIAMKYMEKNGFEYYHQWSQKQVQSRANELNNLDSHVKHKLGFGNKILPPRPSDIESIGMMNNITAQNKSRDEDLAKRLICTLQFNNLKNINQQLRQMDKLVNWIHQK